jgi:AcrR family transcriptional regulator
MTRPAPAAAPAPSPASTRSRLLRAAEKLFAEKGIAQTSARDILREADQRNESALQYHFGGLAGLLDALWAERGGQVNAEREAMAIEMRAEHGVLDVRQLCTLALLPPVLLARRDPEFFEFLKVIGQLAFIPRERLAQAQDRYELGSVKDLIGSIRGAVAAPPAIVERRIDLMSRFAMVALAQRARADQSFDGPDGELYVDAVLDAMAAILSGPISRETRRRLRKGVAGSKVAPAKRGRSGARSMTPTKENTRTRETTGTKGAHS